MRSLLPVLVVATLAFSQVAWAQTRGLTQAGYADQGRTAVEDDCDPSEISAESMQQISQRASSLVSAHQGLNASGRAKQVDQQAMAQRQQQLTASIGPGGPGDHSATVERLRRGDGFDSPLDGQSAVLPGGCNLKKNSPKDSRSGARTR